MASLLVHVTCGTEAPTRVALACLVAKAATEAGHDVSMFFAGDGVTALTAGAVEHLAGLGTGALRDSIPALAGAGVAIYASGMSAKGRGIDDHLAPLGIELAMPSRLVELVMGSDRVLVY